MSTADSGALVIFRVGTVKCSVPVLDVEHISQPPTRFTRIPWAPQGVEGIFDYRSEAAVAVCLRHKFGLPRERRGAGEMVIGRIDGKPKALWVDLVIDVTTAAGSRWTPMPRPISRAVFEGILFYNDWLVLTTTVERLYRMPCAAPLALGAGPDVEEPEVEIPADALSSEEVAEFHVELSSDVEQTSETGEATAEISQPDADHPWPAPSRIVLPFGEPSLTPADPTPRRWALDRPRVAASYQSTPRIVQPVHHPRVFSMASPPAGRIENVVARPDRDDARATARRYSAPTLFIGGAVAAMLTLGIAAVLDTANAYRSRDTSVSGPSNPVVVAQATTERTPSVRPPAARPAHVPALSQMESDKVGSRATPAQPPPAPSVDPTETVAPASVADASPPEPQPAVTVLLEAAAPPSDPRPSAEAAGREPVPVPGRTITHVVKQGDTLWDISERYLGDPFRYPEVARWSNIADPHWIEPGDIVRIVIQ